MRPFRRITAIGSQKAEATAALGVMTLAELTGGATHVFTATVETADGKLSATVEGLPYDALFDEELFRKMVAQKTGRFYSSQRAGESWSWRGEVERAFEDTPEDGEEQKTKRRKR